MLHWTPTLNRYDLVRFIRYERFLTSKAISPDVIWVGPDEALPPIDTQSSRIYVAYSASGRDKVGPRAVTYLRMNGVGVQISSDLHNALTLLAFLYDDPSNMRTFAELDPRLPASEAVRMLGLHYANFLTPKVGQYLPGEHLAKAGSVWRYYLVEDYGEVVPLADCELATPLVARAWADQEAQRTDLASRLAKFNPPDSAQIIAGRQP